MNRIVCFLEHLENHPISFQQFFVSFLGVVFIRNFLETFSDTDNGAVVVWSSDFFLHYPLFYACIFLGLAILLAWFTQEKIYKITRFLLYFLPLIWLAPIIDLVLSGGSGLNMSYIFCSPVELLKRYLQFGGIYHGDGATPGIQIELAVIFALTAIYILVKTRNLKKTILGTFLFYTVVFLFGAAPSIGLLWGKFFPFAPAATARELYSGEVILFHFYTFSQKMILTLLPVFIVELCLWYRMYDAEKFSALLHNLRPLRAGHYLIMLWIGVLIGFGQNRIVSFFATPFPLLVVMAMTVAVLFAWGAAVGINDLHDLKGDRVSNQNRPLPSGVLQPEELRMVSLLLAGLALTIARVIRYPFLVTLLLAFVLSCLYSAPPFRLKRIPFLSAFILAFCAVLVSLSGFVVFSPNYSFHGYPPRVLLAIVVSFTLAIPFKDIKDLAGDKCCQVVTLMTLLGEEIGKKTTGILVGLSYVLAALILGVFALLPVAFLLGTISFFWIAGKHFSEKPLFYAYFLFLLASLYLAYPTFITS